MIELKKYIPTRGYRRNMKNSISIRKNGCIIISQKLAENMELQPGDFIQLAQEANTPDQWFIAKAADGFKARELKGNYVLQNIQLCTDLLNSINKDFETQNGFVILVGAEPVTEQDGQKWFEIITASAK